MFGAHIRGLTTERILLKGGSSAAVRRSTPAVVVTFITRHNLLASRLGREGGIAARVGRSNRLRIVSENTITHCVKELRHDLGPASSPGLRVIHDAAVDSWAMFV
jgi:hypothetical protein